MTIEPLYTVRDVAALFTVTPYTVRQWIKDGKLKASRVGDAGHLRITESNLKTFTEGRHG